MKLKSLAIAALASVMAFASCSKDDAPTIDGGSGDDMKMLVQIKRGGTNTRGVGEMNTTTPVEFDGGRIIFTTNTGVVTKVIDIVDAATAATNVGNGILDDITVVKLESGVLIEDLDAKSGHCYIYANYATGMATEIGNIDVDDNISTIHAKSWGLGDIAATTTAQLAELPLYGYAPVKLTNKEISTGVFADVLFADVTVSPISSRLQIGKITGDDADIVSFTLEGIFINNYFQSLSDINYRLKPVTQRDNSIVVDNYETGKGTYVTDLTMIDHAVAGIGSALTVKSYVPKVAATATDVWHYDVFPTVGYIRDSLPHIVIRLKDVEIMVPVVDADGNMLDAGGNIVTDPDDADKVQKSAGTQFLTVMGYQEYDNVNSQWVSVTELAPAVSYTIKELKFTIDNLSDLPEDVDRKVDGFVEIEVIDWEDKEVDVEWNGN